jgi:hypothetical protein
VGLIRQLFGGNQIFVPRCTIPTDGWCQAPGVGRLNLVWPWYAVDEPLPLVDAFGRDLGITPAVELRAPRSDRDAVLILWAEPGGGGLVGPEWALSVARLHQAALESNAAMALAGVQGRLARVVAGAEVTWRLIFPRQDSVVHVEVSAPRAHADAYWVQVESMLATWSWDV